MTPSEKLAHEANMAYASRDYAKAIEHAREALALDPGELDASRMLGVSQVLSGDTKAGAATLKALIAEYKKRIAAGEFVSGWQQRLNNIPNLLFEQIYEEIHEQEKMARFIQAELGLDHPRVWKVLAVVAMERGDPEGAVPLLEKALAANPAYALGWYNLACANAKLGRKDACFAALGRAIDLGKEDFTDYRQQAMSDPDFAALRSDPGFAALCSRMPEDKDLAPVYAALDESAPDRVLDLGAKIEARAKDKLAVWEAMAEACRIVIEDLDEHGKANASLYKHKKVALQEARHRAQGEDRPRPQEGRDEHRLRALQGMRSIAATDDTAVRD